MAMSQIRQSQSPNSEKSEVGWHEENGTITALDEWWHDKIMMNKDFAKFRGKPLQNYGLMEKLFSDILATGVYTYTPNFSHVHQSMDPNTQEEDVAESSISNSNFERLVTAFETSLGTSRIEKSRNEIKEAISHLKELPGLDIEGSMVIFEARKMIMEDDENYVEDDIYEDDENDLEDDINKEDDEIENMYEDIQNNHRKLMLAEAYHCIGVIDGIHINVVLSADKRKLFYGCEGYTTQNVMAACDFNLCFTYCIGGWEGFAHDTHVFLDTIRDESKNFKRPSMMRVRISNTQIIRI
uniref:Uncharacterized protein LOC105042617 n=1 Tax=Elaeis guineensis var. tenera TaxID=51953 RepID=A0A6I9QZZ3_ELAGV|nr:uncharacterized protein LOC105042617 [Elaeis guineensis]